jgi:hypothetical protein
MPYPQSQTPSRTTLWRRKKAEHARQAAAEAAERAAPEAAPEVAAEAAPEVAALRVEAMDFEKTQRKTGEEGVLKSDEYSGEEESEEEEYEASLQTADDDSEEEDSSEPASSESDDDESESDSDSDSDESEGEGEERDTTRKIPKEQLDERRAELAEAITKAKAQWPRVPKGPDRKEVMSIILMDAIQDMRRVLHKRENKRYVCRGEDFKRCSQIKYFMEREVDKLNGRSAYQLTRIKLAGMIALVEGQTSRHSAVRICNQERDWVQRREYVASRRGKHSKKKVTS